MTVMMTMMMAAMGLLPRMVRQRRGRRRRRLDIISPRHQGLRSGHPNRDEARRRRPAAGAEGHAAHCRNCGEEHGVVEVAIYHEAMMTEGATVAITITMYRTWESCLRLAPEA